MSERRPPSTDLEGLASSPLRPSTMRVESEADLLLVGLLMGAQPSLLMVAAAEARIFDCLGEQELSAAGIAEEAGLDARATRLVLDGLVGLGVLTKKGGFYCNTPTSLRHLRVDTEHSHAVRLWISGTRLWERLPEILRTGSLPEGIGAAEAWRRDSAENRAFIRTIYDLGWLAAQSVAEALDLSEVGHLVDLGGGPGHYTIAMLERSPTMRATVVDLPLTLVVTRGSFQRRGLAHRAELIACDLFALGEDIPVPPSTADLVLISHVLHMEGPEQNATLIQKAARLLTPGGRLIIHDMFLEEDRAHPQASSMFAVHMLAMTQRGEVYPASLMCRWLEEAGLSPRLCSTSPFLIEGRQRPLPLEPDPCESS
jgi:3-hydroxy-5-methyl-1-naphthoate 3-O-methyltransferase